MATYKIHKTKDYTVMSNIHLRDKRMTLKAKGLLSVMLSLPDTWDYSINGLVAICKENNTAVESALKELKTLGYLVVTKRMPNETESGRIEYEYDIYETPQDAQKQPKEKQVAEKQGVENLGVENSQQLNTNQSITEEVIIENKKKERKKEPTRTTYDSILESVQDESLRELYQDYIKMRSMIKAPMTDRALKMLIGRVNELEPHDIARQKKLLETAIMNNWKSVYPIKDESTAYQKNGNGNGGMVEINGKQYIQKNGKYYIKGGSGIAVNPFAADDDLPF